MKKDFYEEIDFEVIAFDSSDVITSSGDPNSDSDETGDLL